MLASRVPTPEQRFRRAEALLQDRFEQWRGRVERAAARVADLAGQADRRALFRRAEEAVRVEQVDGVALLDWSNRARFWAGRTFEIDPEFDCFGVRQGIEVVKVLNHPVHPVLFAARPAGEEIAVAFLAFDERFPEPKSLADEIARKSGLSHIRLRFGNRNVPVRAGTRVLVIDGIVHAALINRTDDAIARERADARGVAYRTILFLAAAVAALGAWRSLGRRVPRDSLLSAGFAIALLAGLRWLLSWLRLPPWIFFHPDVSVHPLWAGAGDTLLTALTACLCAILLVRSAAVARPRRTALVLAALGVGGCLFLPRLYVHLVGLLVRREDGVVLFDTLRVLPDLPATLLLAALCLLTGAVFLCVHAALRWARTAHPWAVPLPYVALALGLLPWQGPWLAVTCALAALSLRARTTRPEKAAAMTVLTALAAFPVLYDAHRTEFVRDVAARAGDLVRHEDSGAVERQLRRVVDAARDPAEGVDREVAQILAEGRAAKNVAFRLWAAGAWEPGQPCAVQVWDLEQRLVSAFDFDSPPAGWLPEPPAPAAEGHRVLAGRGEGEKINFHVHDFPLKTISDEQLVGIARFAVPDRWDMLLSPLRPSIFSEPLDLLVRSAPPPLLLADLDARDGAANATSAGTAADLPPPGAALLAEARQRGYASKRVRFRGQPALLVLAAGRYNFAGLVFEDSLLKGGGFVFAHVMLAFAATWLVYVAGLVVARRGRVHLLFRHRVALVLVLLPLPLAVILAYQNGLDAVQRHEKSITERLDNRLDLAQALLRGREELPDNDWCAAVATNHKVDINVYRRQHLLATSRPGVWDTGLLGRRLAADAYVALMLDGRRDYGGLESFGSALSLRATYRRIQHRGEELIVAAPALEDRRALEREATQGNAVLLAIYLLAATLTVFFALLLARSLTAPVQALREATSRVAAGELDAKLPDTRQDEFGDLIRSFNRMTVDLRDAQDLRVRAEKAAAWREMASQVAHEIKNPLTPIKLTVQNLLASYQDDPESFQEDFDRGAELILDQIEALHRIAGAFSAYARFPAQKPTALDLNELMTEVADFYGATGKGHIQVQAAPQRLVVRADHDELRRVMINLVTNARQAGAQRVVLRAAPEDGQARLDVIDDGAGIPPEVQERIFDPSFTTKTSGTGLGMPIVKRIIDDYGGTIQLVSTDGGGTCVTIRLPLSTVRSSKDGKSG